MRLEYPDLEAGLDFPDDFPKVYADPDKVEQVLTNLVENACKYASPTGIVDRRAPADDGEVSVTVTDQGEGIPAADLPKVFTKFFRRVRGPPDRLGPRAVDQPGPGRGPRRPAGGRVNCGAGDGVSLYAAPDRPGGPAPPVTDRDLIDELAARSRPTAGPGIAGGRPTVDELRAAETELLGKRSALARLSAQLRRL